MPGHKHVEAFKVETSHAGSDDRILKGKRIDRHDGSGDRQKCRPPFCVLGIRIVVGRNGQRVPCRRQSVNMATQWRVSTTRQPLARIAAILAIDGLIRCGGGMLC